MFWFSDPVTLQKESLANKPKNTNQTEIQTKKIKENPLSYNELPHLRPNAFPRLSLNCGSGRESYCEAAGNTKIAYHCERKSKTGRGAKVAGSEVKRKTKVLGNLQGAKKNEQGGAERRCVVLPFLSAIEAKHEEVFTDISPHSHKLGRETSLPYSVFPFPPLSLKTKLPSFITLPPRKKKTAGLIFNIPNGNPKPGGAQKSQGAKISANEGEGEVAGSKEKRTGRGGRRCVVPPCLSVIKANYEA